MEIRLGIIEISEDGEQKINFKDSIDQSTLEKLKLNISKLEKFRLHSELHSIFLINFIELSRYFEETIDELTKKQVVMLRNNTKDFRHIIRNANRLILNLLSSGRTLTDHQETYLKKEYGKESNEAIRYKTFTSKIFDSFFEYRFIYKLRNYAQHCGFPISHLKFETKNERQNQKRNIYARLNPLFNRDELLKKYDGWGQIVKNDLKNQAQEFPVMWTIGRYYKCTETINCEFEAIELDKVSIPLQETKNFLQRFGQLVKNVEPCVFYDFQYSTPNSYENSKFTSQTIPLDLISEIDKKLKAAQQKNLLVKEKIK
jgi:hypothetical protein